MKMPEIHSCRYIGQDHDGIRILDVYLDWMPEDTNETVYQFIVDTLTTLGTVEEITILNFEHFASFDSDRYSKFKIDSEGFVQLSNNYKPINSDKLEMYL